MYGDLGMGAKAQMGIEPRLKQVLSQNMEIAQVDVLQAKVYGSSTLFMAGHSASQEMLDRLEYRARIGNERVIQMHIIGKPMSGKTHELGERVGYGNFNRQFLRGLLEAGRETRTVAANTTIIASGLALMDDSKGRPLVWHKDASEWEPEERARIAEAMYRVAERAPEVLPRIAPQYDVQILASEWLVAFLDPRGVPQTNGASFNQFRLVNQRAVEEASNQRIALRKDGKSPVEAYSAAHGIIDKDVAADLLKARVGSPESNARQEVILGNKYLQEHDRLVQRGVPEFGEAELADQRFRDETLLPEYYRLLMEDWKVVEGLNGVIVPNDYVDGRRKKRRYHAALIEAYKIDVRDFVDVSEIRAVA